MRRPILILTAFAMTALGGCDRLTPQSEPAAALGDERSGKLAAYDSIVRQYDLEGAREEYEARNIASARPEDDIFIDIGHIEAGLLDLKRAREMPGSLGPIDVAASEASKPLQRLLDRGKGLESYFTTRGQLADGFARARREDPLMRADFAAALAAYAPFAAAVERARDEEWTAKLPRLKADGHLVEYYDILILRKARDLVRGMPAEGAAEDPAATARTDAMVPELLALLDQGRAARKQRDSEGLDSSGGVISAVEQMIGNYRDFRRTKNADARGKVTEAYKAAAASIG